MLSEGRSPRKLRLCRADTYSDTASTVRTVQYMHVQWGRVTVYVHVVWVTVSRTGTSCSSKVEECARARRAP